MPHRKLIHFILAAFHKKRRFMRKQVLIGLVWGVLCVSFGVCAQFLPKDLDGCVLWLDASDTSTIDLTSGAAVSRWADKSGSGADFIRVAGEPSPVVIKSAIGGQPAADFRGGRILVSQKKEYFDFLHNGASVTLFAVFETSQEHPRKYMAVLGSGCDDKKNIGFSLAFNDSDIFHENNALAVQVGNGESLTINIRRLRGDENYALLPQRPNVVSYVFDGENNIAQAYVFGDKVAQVQSVGVFSKAASSSKLAIGAVDEKAKFGFDGRIAEIIIYTRALNDDEREKVEKYLIGKFDISPAAKVVLDSRCKRMDLLKQPCAIEKDGTLLAFDEGGLYESKDGQTWTLRGNDLADPQEPAVKAGGLMAVTPKGTLVSFTVKKQGSVKLDYKDGKFNSDKASYPVYAIRSFDGGRTWTDCRLLQPGYCGAMRGLIVTKQGHIVLCIQKWDIVNERHITTVYVSDDDGATYKSCEVDNGIGRGLHDGFFESTIAELSDGRILMLGRTCLGVFWQSQSDDGGFSWSKPRATNISAGGYPGYLLSLKSGRLVLVWNRFYPDGGEGDESLVGMASVSWFWGQRRVARFSRELSIMFSDDDGKSWSKPLVLAEGAQDNIRLAYPKMMEIGDGDIYIWAGMMATKINEKDFN